MRRSPFVLRVFLAVAALIMAAVVTPIAWAAPADTVHVWTVRIQRYPKCWWPHEATSIPPEPDRKEPLLKRSRGDRIRYVSMDGPCRLVFLGPSPIARPDSPSVRVPQVEVYPEGDRRTEEFIMGDKALPAGRVWGRYHFEVLGLEDPIIPTEHIPNQYGQTGHAPNWSGSDRCPCHSCDSKPWGILQIGPGQDGEG